SGLTANACNTVSVTCDIVGSVDPANPTQPKKLAATDNAVCGVPSVKIAKQCAAQAGGVNQMTFTVTNTGGVALANCAISDNLFMTSPTCPPTGTATAVATTPATIASLAPGDTASATGSVSGLTADACDDVTVSCDVLGGGGQVTSEDQKGYGLGTSLTEVRGHRLHRGDALDANECDGTAAEVRGGLRKRPVVDDGALRAVRCDAADRLQVGGPLSGGGQPGDDRAKPGAARVPASDAGEDRGADPHRPHGVRMGSEEAPADAPDASARDRLAGAQYGQRHPRAARQAPQAPASQAVDAPGSRSARDAATEPGVAGGLQGAVQDPRRAILLPADGHRSPQPDAPCVPRPVVGEDRGGEARVPRPVPRGRPPRSDPDRQRDTVRVDG